MNRPAGDTAKLNIHVHVFCGRLHYMSIHHIQYGQDIGAGVVLGLQYYDDVSI